MDLTKIKEMPIKELIDELKSRGFFINNTPDYFKRNEKFFSIIDEKPDYIVNVDWIDDSLEDEKIVVIQYSDINGKSTISNYIN